MKNNLSQTLMSFGVGLAIATSILPLAQSATAETLARVQGRCKLTSETNTLFDGHCVTKQKQQDDTTVFVIELDDGSEYRFFGENKQALQVETSDGIHNVQFTENPDKGVFVWEEDGDSNRLSVKLDAQYDPDVSHDDTEPSLGTALGAAVGAAIGSLITGGKPTQLPSTPTSTAQTEQPDPALAFARDKCASALVQRTGQRVGMRDDTLTIYQVSNAQNGLRGNATLNDGGGIQFDCVVNIRSGKVESLKYK